MRYAHQASNSRDIKEKDNFLGLRIIRKKNQMSHISVLFFNEKKHPLKYTEIKRC